jgi:hypothetical protein
MLSGAARSPRSNLSRSASLAKGVVSPRDLVGNKAQ